MIQKLLFVGLLGLLFAGQTNAQQAHSTLSAKLLCSVKGSIVSFGPANKSDVRYLRRASHCCSKKAHIAIETLTLRNLKKGKFKSAICN